MIIYMKDEHFKTVPELRFVMLLACVSFSLEEQRAILEWFPRLYELNVML